MNTPFSKTQVTFNQDLAVSRRVLRPAIPEQTLTQYLGRVAHVPGQQVEAMVGYGTIGADGLIKFDDASVKIHTFTGAAYAALMSDKPSWSPDKPAGVYRDSDIFAFIDFIAEEIAKEKRAEAVKAAEVAATAEAAAANSGKPVGV